MDSNTSHSTLFVLYNSSLQYYNSNRHIFRCLYYQSYRCQQKQWDFFMGVLNILIFQALQTFSGWLLDSHHEHTITQLPGSIWAALSKFDIDTKPIVYTVCQKCHCTYPLQTSLGESTAKYPLHCTNCPTPSSDECGQPLLRCDKSNQKSSKPIKPFVYHSFHNYLASLLSIRI